MDRKIDMWTEKWTKSRDGQKNGLVYRNVDKI